MVNDLKLFTGLLVGFIAYSIPLLLHDTQHLWATAAPSPGEDDATPPSPPPWTYHHDENDPGSKFRTAVADGNLEEAEILLTASLREEPPVDLVTQKHWHGSTPLFEAARSGHLEVAKWLVSKGADADQSNEWGDSPVNEAASMGHWDVVWYLADQGANLTRTTEHAHTSLVLSAVRHRSTSALEQMAQRGVDLNQRHWNGNTVLHEAARMGEAEMVSWLLAHSDLDVNATNDSGEGAIAEAAMMGHSDVLWKLIDAGADLGEPGSNQANSLLHSATRHGSVDVLDRLALHGVVTAEVINAPDKHNRLLLLEAVRAGQLATVEWLLQHGANASHTNDQGESALAVAASEDKFQIVWRLHEAGAPLDALNEYGGTALMAAVHHGHEEDVVRLLSLGLDANHANKRGDTPLTLAASRGDLDMMRMLMDRGAKADARGVRADTPLLRAARFKKVDAVRFLLDSGNGDLSHQNRKGDTALLEACRAGSVGVTELLLQRGDAHAQLSHSNKHGNTALLEAAETGALDLIKMLVEHGAEVTARNLDDQGALDLSRWSHRSDEIKEFLEPLGAVPPKEDEGYHHDDHYKGYRDD